MLEVLGSLPTDILFDRGVELEGEEPLMLLRQSTQYILLKVSDRVTSGECRAEVRDLGAYGGDTRTHRDQRIYSEDTLQLL